MLRYCMCLGMAMSLTSLALADDEPSKAPEGGRRGRGPNREEILKRFDKDGDGKLSEEERAEARKEFGNRFGGGKGRGPGGRRPGGEEKKEEKKEESK